MHAAIVQADPRPLASYTRRGQPAESYRLWADGPILRAVGRGEWDMTVARAYAADISRVVATLRLRQPLLRAIVDRSVAPSFDVGVRDLLMATYATVLRDGDRIAMVVDSSVTKGLVRQLAGREDTQSFLSLSAARTWVMAYG